jgi:spermidine/putrescine transport system ATP-binding protein
VGLTTFADRRPRDLSGGQQQRVELARALISRPTVLLLDEPLGSLDFNLRQAMMIELKKVQRELNITFIMVTHSQQEAMSLADKVIVMSDAVIQQIGTSREVHENPRTKFVAEFIGNNNLFRGRIRSRSGSMVFVEALGQLLYVKVPPDVRHVPVGKEVWFSVRADLMNTGEKEDMANRIEGKYIASEFLGSLETDVFEVAPGHYVHVEQHRHAQDRIYKIGERETLCWNTESGVLLEDSRRAENLDAA